MYPCGRDWLKLKRQKTLLKLKVLKAGRPSTGSGRLPPAYSLALKSRIVWLPRAYWVALKRRNIHHEVNPLYQKEYTIYIICENKPKKKCTYRLKRFEN